MTRTLPIRTSLAAQMRREAGLALSVLAIWLLVLMAPLHQVSGAQRALQEAGILPPGRLLCQPVRDETGEDRQQQPPCPFQHLGSSLATPPDAGLPAVFDPAIASVLGRVARRIPIRARRQRLR